MSAVHCFLVSDAELFGVEKAVILYNLRFWLDKNVANDINLHDGHYWTYNKAKAFALLFPYITARKISKLLRELESSGFIKSGVYNENKNDQTKWYTMPQYSISALKAAKSKSIPKQDIPMSKLGHSNVPKRDTVLTDINKDINENNKIKNKSEKTVGHEREVKAHIKSRIADINDISW
jgi:hypothetical protein